jgi:hypothetical protein
MRNDMEIERVPIAQLKPYPKTLRIHNRKKRAASWPRSCDASDKRSRY